MITSNRNPDDESLADQLEEIAQHCASLPVLDARQPEEILDYDPAGLPR